MAQRVTHEEFQQRLQDIRGLMSKRKLDALIIYSHKRGHVAYVSGYQPNYHANAAIVLLPLQGNPILWIRFPFDLQRARTLSWFGDIRASSSEDIGRMVAECTNVIGTLGLERSRIGLVATDVSIDEVSVSLYESVRNQLPGAQIELTSDVLNDLRLLKSKREIENLREASRMADFVAECFKKQIRPGEKDHSATAAAEHVARREGADTCFILLSTDPSRLAMVPLNFEFHKKSLVTCEITVQLHGYWVQICRVYCIGKPSREQTEVFVVCRKAYEAAVAAAQPGNPVAELALAARKVIAEADYEPYIQYGVGHGVGLDLPELYPVELGCDALLAPNVVLVLHPAIWVPNKGAAFVGGPIVVTERGAARLDQPRSEIIEV